MSSVLAVAGVWLAGTLVVALLAGFALRTAGLAADDPDPAAAPPLTAVPPPGAVTEPEPGATAA